MCIPGWCLLLHGAGLGQRVKEGALYCLRVHSPGGLPAMGTCSKSGRGQSPQPASLGAGPGPLALCPSLQGPAHGSLGANRGAGAAVRSGCGGWSAAPSAQSRTGTETGHTPGEETIPTSGEKGWDQHPPSPRAAHWCPCSTPSPKLPTWVTHQVTKFYGGHGCLEDGPETPKEMGGQGIPEGQAG